ncbi:sp110 nuclear body protein [Amia ocellicauda]|uniref:sp110 nuclear body protein n=1 Tax=Amia ocellicauda TaxID=2972642 RepID=UPI0034646059
MDRETRGTSAQGWDLGFFTEEQLHDFFKKEIVVLSNTEEPIRLLRCLKTDGIITREEYKKVSGTAEGPERETEMYNVLDRLEEQKPHLIKGFWSRAFQDSILKQNPTLQRLQQELLRYLPSPEMLERLKARDEQRREEQPSTSSSSLQPRMFPSTPEQDYTTGYDEEFETRPDSPASSGTLQRVEISEEEEDPGPSRLSMLLQPRKTPHEPPQASVIQVSSEEEDSAELASPIPVTCGEKEGMLHPDIFAKGTRQMSIFSEGQWFSPSEFEMFGGKGSNRKWKTSIKHLGKSLEKVIKERHLRCPVQNPKTKE